MSYSLIWDQSTNADDERIVSLHGELDLNLAGQLRDVLIGQLADAATLIVDLADVGFLDSAALGALIYAHQQARFTWPCSSTPSS